MNIKLFIIMFHTSSQNSMFIYICRMSETLSAISLMSIIARYARNCWLQATLLTQEQRRSHFQTSSHALVTASHISPRACTR